MKKLSTTSSDLKSRLAAPPLLIHSVQFSMITSTNDNRQYLVQKNIYVILYLQIRIVVVDGDIFKYNFIKSIKIDIFALDKCKKKN